jgi:hypothetical protein
VSVEPPWVKVSRPFLDSVAGQLDQPLPLRIALLAYGRVEANGHAEFRRGELAEITGKDRRNVSRAIRNAIEKGWLLEGSCTECLLPPGDYVEMSYGSNRKRCRVHSTLGLVKIDHKKQQTHSRSSEANGVSLNDTDVISHRRQSVAVIDTPAVLRLSEETVA